SPGVARDAEDGVVVFELNRHGCRRYAVLNGTPRRLRIEVPNPKFGLGNKPESRSPKSQAPTVRRERSAELHSAVSPNCIRLAARHPQHLGLFESVAEYNSAIQRSAAQPQPK